MRNYSAEEISANIKNHHYKDAAHGLSYDSVHMSKHQFKKLVDRVDHKLHDAYLPHLHVSRDDHGGIRKIDYGSHHLYVSHHQPLAHARRTQASQVHDRHTLSESRHQHGAPFLAADDNAVPSIRPHSRRPFYTSSEDVIPRRRTWTSDADATASVYRPAASMAVEPARFRTGVNRAMPTEFQDPGVTAPRDSASAYYRRANFRNSSDLAPDSSPRLDPAVYFQGTNEAPANISPRRVTPVADVSPSRTDTYRPVFAPGSSFRSQPDIASADAPPVVAQSTETRRNSLVRGRQEQRLEPQALTPETKAQTDGPQRRQTTETHLQVASEQIRKYPFKLIGLIPNAPGEQTVQSGVTTTIWNNGNVKTTLQEYANGRSKVTQDTVTSSDSSRLEVNFNKVNLESTYVLVDQDGSSERASYDLRGNQTLLMKSHPKDQKPDPNDKQALSEFHRRNMSMRSDYDYTKEGRLSYRHDVVIYSFDNNMSYDRRTTYDEQGHNRSVVQFSNRSLAPINGHLDSNSVFIPDPGQAQAPAVSERDMSRVAPAYKDKQLSPRAAAGESHFDQQIKQIESGAPRRNFYQ